MRPNRLREIWAGGGAVVNGWMQIPHGFACEIMANQGWDSLTIDLQVPVWRNLNDNSRRLTKSVFFAENDFGFA